MKVKDLFKWWGNVDLGVFLKFYGRIFFASVAVILFLLIMVSSFMAAPVFTIILLVCVLSAAAWIVGEIMTSQEEEGVVTKIEVLHDSHREGPGEW